MKDERFLGEILLNKQPAISRLFFSDAALHFSRREGSFESRFAVMSADVISVFFYGFYEIKKISLLSRVIFAV